MFYAQFREGDAILYTEEEWFTWTLQPNYRRARIEAEDQDGAEAAFATLAKACREARPTVDWSNVSPLVKEF